MKTYFFAVVSRCFRSVLGWPAALVALAMLAGCKEKTSPTSPMLNLQVKAIEQGGSGTGLEDVEIFLDEEPLGTTTKGVLKKAVTEFSNQRMLRGYKGGYEFGSMLINVENIKSGEITLQMPAVKFTLRLVVHTEDVEGFGAQPIAGAEVRMNGVRLDTTDTGGNLVRSFKLDPVNTPEVALKIEKAGVKFKRADTTFALRDDTLDYAIVFLADAPPPRRFEVTVLDAKGQPKPGVKINTPINAETLPATDVNGVSQFTLLRRAGDKVQLTFSESYFTLKTRVETVTAGKTVYPVMINLPDLKRINATVRADGSALSGAQIFVDGQLLRLIDQTGVREDRTSANGKLEAFIPLENKQSYRFAASRSGYETVSGVEKGRPTPNSIEVEFTTRKVVVLVVKTKRTGAQKPEDGVKIYFHPETGQTKVLTTQNGEAIIKESGDLKGRLEVFDPKSTFQKEEQISYGWREAPYVKDYTLPEAKTSLTLTVVDEETQQPIEVDVVFNNQSLGPSPLNARPVDAGSQTFTLIPHQRYRTRFVTDYRVTLNLPAGPSNKTVAMPLNRRKSAEDKINAGNFRGAVEDLNKITEKTPGYNDLVFLRGFIYEKHLKQLPAAKKDYQTVVGRDPQYAPAHFYLGSLLFKEAENSGVTPVYLEALKHFKDVLLYQRFLSANVTERNEQLFLTRYQLAKAYQETNQDVQAKRAWQEFFDFIPKQNFNVSNYQKYITEAESLCQNCQK